jgi:hypothetical protein
MCYLMLHKVRGGYDHTGSATGIPPRDPTPHRGPGRRASVGDGSGCHRRWCSGCEGRPRGVCQVERPGTWYACQACTMPIEVDW